MNITNVTTPKNDRASWLKGSNAVCSALPQLIPEKTWRLVLLGSPGVGKGTQAELLARGGRTLVLLRPDSDLAELYQVETRALIQAVKRNMDRFPEDFMFRLSKEEFQSLKSQFVTLKEGRGRHRKYLPYAFTDQGVAMLSSVLHSPRAVHAPAAGARSRASSSSPACCSP